MHGGKIDFSRPLFFFKFIGVRNVALLFDLIKTAGWINNNAGETFRPNAHHRTCFIEFHAGDCDDFLRKILCPVLSVLVQKIENGG